jgi:hypothetical protein
MLSFSLAEEDLPPRGESTKRLIGTDRGMGLIWDGLQGGPIKSPEHHGEEPNESNFGKKDKTEKLHEGVTNSRGSDSQGPNVSVALYSV